MTSVAILDYGFGNVRSAERAVARHGADVTITSDFEACLQADGLRRVLGHRLIGRRLAGGRPVLGICVGMQILFERGIEHGMETAGCGEWPGTVKLLDAPVVPQMGWNTMTLPEDSTMFAGLDNETRFYFVHSYAAQEWALTDTGSMPTPKVAWCDYGARPFVAAVENSALWATQFHPEKSGDAGAQLLANWIKTL